MTEYKKLNIYRRPSVAEKEAVIKVTGAKDIRMEYDMHVFTGQDFQEHDKPNSLVGRLGNPTFYIINYYLCLFSDSFS